MVIRMELPGADPEKDLEITVEDGTPCVWGERRFNDEGMRYRRREVPRGAFERAAAVPKVLKPEDIKMGGAEPGRQPAPVPGRHAADAVQ